MRYYDNAFRKNLIEMLNTYRRILSQMELSQDKSFSNIFISDSIKKIDEAVKIIRPSAFDFLTEKKIEKLQTSDYYTFQIAKIENEFEKKLKQEIEKSNKVLEEKVRQETESQLREQLTKEIRAELEVQIRKEISDKETNENSISEEKESDTTSEPSDKEDTPSENTEDNAFTDFDEEENFPPVE